MMSTFPNRRGAARRRALPRLMPVPIPARPTPEHIALDGDPSDPLFSCLSRALLSMSKTLQDRVIERIHQYLGNDPLRFGKRGLDTMTLRCCVALRLCKHADEDSQVELQVIKLTGRYSGALDTKSLFPFICNPKLYPGDCFAIDTIEKVSGVNFAVVYQSTHELMRRPNWPDPAWSALLISKGSNKWAQCVVGTKGCWEGSSTWNRMLGLAFS